jgi:vacuolar-type H+-ATPase subunit F/Vma7
LKISWIKAKSDTYSFKFPKTMGLDVFDIEDLEKTDIKINELVQKNYNTIIMTNEVAGFSEDIIKKYKNNEEINIIIAPLKKE